MREVRIGKDKKICGRTCVVYWAKWSDASSLDSLVKREIPSKKSSREWASASKIELDPESFADCFDNRMSREKGGKPACENIRCVNLFVVVIDTLDVQLLHILKWHAFHVCPWQLTRNLMTYKMCFFILIIIITNNKHLKKKDSNNKSKSSFIFKIC